MRHQCFAVCAPGLEDIVHTEIQALGVRRPRTTRGGVTFDASTRQLYAVNVWSRTATRVLVRVARFRARDFITLERVASDIRWDDWIAPGRPVRFRVTSTGSALYHTGAIEERLRRVMGAPPPAGPASEGQLVVVRVHRDELTVSVDSSGEPLYKRGWRAHSAKAPLRETLAAAMLLASEWSSDEPLLDPFCGSGTIAIEAALLAQDRAPGATRAFAFQDWPAFEPGTWASVRAEIDARAKPEREIHIEANDRDDGAVAIARENAERAGVAGLHIRRATISELDRPAGIEQAGWVISNPPYGRRVSHTGDLRDLYARFGNVARARLPAWRIGLLVADQRLAGHTGFDWTERFRTDNGGIPVRYLTATVEEPPAGPPPTVAS